MFATPQHVAAGLREAGYATDPVLVQIVWLATKRKGCGAHHQGSQ
jgi:hypothetical protein